MKKKGTPLNDLENQRIDSSKVLGGQKQLSSEFVNTVEAKEANRQGGEKNAFLTKNRIIRNNKK